MAKLILLVGLLWAMLAVPAVGKVAPGASRHLPAARHRRRLGH